jgi:hypothetical protein
MAISHNSSHVCSQRLTLRAAAARVAATALSAAILAAGGCGAGHNGHPTARLEGQVTVDGQPIHNGRIQFFPIRGGGQPCDSEINDGHYLAELVPNGKVRVVFTSVKETGKMIHEPGHTFPELVSIIPEQYQSGIEIDVDGDNPKQDFKLVSKASGASGKGG